MNYLSQNIEHLSASIQERLKSHSPQGELFENKPGVWNLKLGPVNFHSKHDPHKEAERFYSELPPDSEERVLIFFGAGLGYILQKALEREKTTLVWMEAEVDVLYHALSIWDWTESLASGKLKILLSPVPENEFFDCFRGLSTLPVTFVPHRASFSYNEEGYKSLRFLCEGFFQKKDVNIATLTRFEKLWTRNMIQNLPELFQLKPVSRLFGIAEGIPIVVAGAGPSLASSLEDLKRWRDRFFLIAVDTALVILKGGGIDPDLVYSVDPQTLNSSYLETYEGEAYLVFDPTSSYSSLRLTHGIHKGFFTSSPFPLLQLVQSFCQEEIGEVAFGGSVSTNATSLAEKMGASVVYLVGQDLAFTDGYAHAKGAILEERLNYKESRTFRREFHNQKQRTALAKKQVPAIGGGLLETNEKMLIFRKWFSEESKGKSWKNLTPKGAKLDNIPESDFRTAFAYLDSTMVEKIQSVRNKISFSAESPISFDFEGLLAEIRSILSELKRFQKLLESGLTLAEKIYDRIQRKIPDPREFQSLLKEMDFIDETVASKQGLHRIVSLSIQRVILSITEGYETNLTIEEKKDERLGVAKKSILLYNGLLESVALNRRLLRKTEIRLLREKSFLPTIN